MAVLLRNPKINDATKDEWRVMIQDLEAFTVGVLRIGVENIDSAGEPRILMGSMVALHGSKFVCTMDEDIGGTAVPGRNYIYAFYAHDGKSVSFVYSAVSPSWDGGHGGWYAEFDNEGRSPGDDGFDENKANGARAVAKLFFTGGNYNNKVMLDSYNAMFANNTEQPAQETGGQLVYDSKSVPNDEEISMEPGVYRYELKGGSGGLGGAGGEGGAGSGSARPGQPGLAGIPGLAGVPIAGTFIHAGGKLRITVGADGGDGGEGGKGSDGIRGTSGSDGRDPVHGGNGGFGGCGGGGLDSRIEGVATAHGGAAGNVHGGDTTYIKMAMLRNISMIGASGGTGTGGGGGMGAYSENTISFVNMGFPGHPAKAVSSGYAIIWRTG